MFRFLHKLPGANKLAARVFRVSLDGIHLKMPEDRLDGSWSFEVQVITGQVLYSILALKHAHNLGLGGDRGPMILLCSLFDMQKCKVGALEGQWGGFTRRACHPHVHCFTRQWLLLQCSKQREILSRNTAANGRFSDFESLRSPQPWVSAPKPGVTGSLPGFLEGSSNKSKCTYN